MCKPIFFYTGTFPCQISLFPDCRLKVTLFCRDNLLDPWDKKMKHYLSFCQLKLIKITSILPRGVLGVSSRVLSLVHQCCGSQPWIALTQHMRGLPWTTGGPGYAMWDKPRWDPKVQLFLLKLMYTSSLALTFRNSI